jgi:hypothetical protein
MLLNDLKGKQKYIRVFRKCTYYQLFCYKYTYKNCLVFLLGMISFYFTYFQNFR